MSNLTTYGTKTESKSAAAPSEAKATAKEGKRYAYQRPQESLAPGSKLAEGKAKVVSAFDEFMDAIAEQATTAVSTPASGATDASAGTGAAAGGSASSGAAASGSKPATTATTTTPSTAGTRPGAGAASTGGGSPAAGAPSAGTGTAPGASGRGGEQPATSQTTKGSDEAVRLEALETARKAQVYAYQRDRTRESARSATRQRRPAAGPGASGGSALAPSVNEAIKHTSDSNRAPLKRTSEFQSSYGLLGKAAAPTIEVQAVRAARPETVPAPGAVSNPKPIDAYWGSFGTSIEKAAARAQVDMKMLESIIGSDDRTRVTNVQVYPWRCICSLLITANTGAQYLGTGWLVSPRVLLTAGHCVYMADEGGWVTQMDIAPGRDADTRPFGTTIAREFRSVTGWTQDNDSNYDYGAILLPAESRLGEQLGWFGYAARNDDYLQDLTLNLSGYPGDGGKDHIDGTQWYHSRKVMAAQERQITYDIDTYGGQSGSPVWEFASDGNRYGVAIHTFGTTVNNGGTRITSDVMNNILSWVGEAP